MQQVKNLIEPEIRFDDSKLVFMLGEELKKPLTAIKALAESSGHNAVQLEARKALRTVDNILYYQQLASRQTELSFTTVHAGSTLTNVSHALVPLSLERGCETEIYIQSGVSPVHADPNVLRFGIESLWQAVLGMTNKPSPLSWQIYRSPNGIRLTIANSSLDLSKVKLSSSTAGSATQPFKGISGPATDLITAQSLFGLMGAKLSKFKKDGRQGLSITLPISAQLALV